MVNLDLNIDPTKVNETEEEVEGTTTDNNGRTKITPTSLHLPVTSVIVAVRKVSLCQLLRDLVSPN